MNTIGHTADLLRLVPMQHPLRHEWWSSVLRASISGQIKALRESRGWSQADLAKKLGKHQTKITRLENPAFPNAPTIQTLCEIAAVFDVALIVKFEGWSDAVAFIAGAVVPLSFDQERSVIDREAPK